MIGPLLLGVAALAGCSGAVDAEACAEAGGVCEDLTPGACLGMSPGDEATYPCDDDQICCLPSPCVTAGGSCTMASCTSGHLDESLSCGNGAGQCCMP